MDVASLLHELYGRIPPLARDAVRGVPVDRLTEAPGPGANTIAWLVWHLTRVQDHHISELLDTEQLWETGDWAKRFGLAPEPTNTGYGHTAEDIATVRPESADALLDYLDEAAARSGSLLSALRPEHLDRVIDQSWNPPVTLGVRLISVADDCLQHAGQAAYVRGLLGF